MFKQIAKVDFTYVAYKGGGPAIIDQVGGSRGCGILDASRSCALREERQAARVDGDGREALACRAGHPGGHGSGLADMVLITWNGVSRQPRHQRRSSTG